MRTIILENLTVKYGCEFIFSSVSLSIPYGKYILKGKNGVGKSTFFRLLCGLQKPTKGHIRIKGPIDLVTEGVYFPDNMNVQTIFSLYERYQRTDVALRDEMIEKFSFHQYLAATLSSLSQGNCQKLRLILGLSGKGHWLLLDEPFNGLDKDSAVLLNELIIGVNKPVILVDHSQQYIFGGFSTLFIENKKICIA